MPPFNAIKREHTLRAVSVNPTHVHFVIELPDDVPTIKEAVGWLKRFATRAIRESTDRFDRCDIWAAAETYKPIDSDDHLHRAITYVLTKQGRDAWTWEPTRGGSW